MEKTWLPPKTRGPSFHYMAFVMIKRPRVRRKVVKVVQSKEGNDLVRPQGATGVERFGENLVLEPGPRLGTGKDLCSGNPAGTHSVSHLARRGLAVQQRLLLLNNPNIVKEIVRKKL